MNNMLILTCTEALIHRRFKKYFSEGLEKFPRKCPGWSFYKFTKGLFRTMWLRPVLFSALVSPYNKIHFQIFSRLFVSAGYGLQNVITETFLFLVGFKLQFKNYYNRKNIAFVCLLYFLTHIMPFSHVFLKFAGSTEKGQ